MISLTLAPAEPAVACLSRSVRAGRRRAAERLSNRMRLLKVMLITFLLGMIGIIACFEAYLHLYRSPHLYRKWKSESIAALQAAHSTAELTNAVGSLGLYIALTNGGWIAIRYRDTHSLPIVSCAIARDSDGGWFESNRHFCGSLSSWPRHREQVAGEEELRRTVPDLFTNSAPQTEAPSGSFPSYREMMMIESAADLGSARAALQKIGFSPFTKRKE